MATDCYILFKTTYAQAIADGLATAVALAAAQAAMSACLQAQNERPPTTTTTITVAEGTLRDAGPLMPVPEKVQK